MPLHWKAPQGLFADRRDVKGVFQTIYDRNVWGGGSGIGSNPQVAREYVQFLQCFIHNNHISAVVDIGCGDWQFSRHIDWGNRTYVGIDVVPGVIEENTRRFGRERIAFRCLNPLDAGFVAPPGDLLLMKDVLQHLSNENVKKLLGLARQYRFALITNDFAAENVDCENGDTRPLDIRLEPFNMSAAALVYAFQLRGAAPKAVFLVVR